VPTNLKRVANKEIAAGIGLEGRRIRSIVRRSVFSRYIVFSTYVDITYI